MKTIEISIKEKSFKSNLLFKDVSLTLNSGHIYGICGPNGTGKSVLLKMIAGLSLPTQGYISIDNKVIGKDIEFAPSIGVIIDKPAFIDEYNGIDNLKLLANIRHNIDDTTIHHYFTLFGLTDKRKSVSKYSLGMRQRLGLAQAFMESPELLLLDEYSNGLDKSGVAQVKQIIKDYANDERIIIVTSHYSQDLTDICDTIYEINNYNLELL